MLGLLKDDTQWHKAMAEAASFQMPCQLRRMFAMILTHVILLIHYSYGQIISQA